MRRRLAYGLIAQVTLSQSGNELSMTDPRSEPGPHTLHPAWPQVDALLEPWRRMDIAAIAATFEPDSVLHSMMGTPIRGQASIRKVLGKHLAGIRRIEFEIRTLATIGEVVILERIDHVYTADGEQHFRGLELSAQGIDDTQHVFQPQGGLACFKIDDEAHANPCR